ncbi:MipA/OmpV family protein [Porticoccus sp. W117]|uniref:MipA/OmpV family protein n=1 Tax=Porticoccus sp. W117 TaxID=3054777 RepID=UPI002596ECA4|nr:MipA/OmpV family protein [Porticoccus sp. W117]MDM3869839.1 MipA/OmpV family protein [Porticoccus sp. W117]
MTHSGFPERIKWLFCGLLTAAPFLVVAEDAKNAKPEWELGIGIGGQALPAYRGSDEYQLRLAPFPLVNYNGDFLKADDEGIRGEFFADNRFELNVSAELSLAQDDDDDTLRRGMPELLPTFELGPDLVVNLSGDTVREGWALHLPVRTVVASDFSEIDYIGWVANPHIAFRQKGYIGNWDVVAQAGLLYGSERYHDYFYEVAPAFETADRQRFNASSGYSGSVFRVGLRQRVDRLWMGGSLRFDYLGGATFEDSPLVESTSSVTLTFGIGWYLSKIGSAD